MNGSWIDRFAGVGWTLLFIAFVLGLASDRMPELAASVDRLVPAYGLVFVALLVGLSRSAGTQDHVGAAPSRGPAPPPGHRPLGSPRCPSPENRRVEAGAGPSPESRHDGS